MSTMPTTTDLTDIIKARREDIRQQAQCTGCGTTLADCLPLLKSSDAPFGCCSDEQHIPDPAAYEKLMDEIATGEVVTAESLRQARTKRKAERDRRRAASTPPGEWRPLTGSALYDQGVWWKAKEEGWLRITDMAISHRAGTAKWLIRRSKAIAWSLGFSDLGLMSGAPDDVMDSFMQEDERRNADPEKWMRSTKLYRALTADLPDDSRQLNDALAEQSRKDVA